MYERTCTELTAPIDASLCLREPMTRSAALHVTLTVLTAESIVGTTTHRCEWT